MQQEMQQSLQRLQYSYKIYNGEIEPEHDTDYWCNCAIHNYQRRRQARLGIQRQWCDAVMYPGEKFYHNNFQTQLLGTSNPYRWGVVSPYGNYGAQSNWGMLPQVSPKWHSVSVRQTIDLNHQLNDKAQNEIDAQEPRFNIWNHDELSAAMAKLSVDRNSHPEDKKSPPDQRNRISTSDNGKSSKTAKKSKFASFKKGLGMKTADEKEIIRIEKAIAFAQGIRNSILQEESGRWQDDQWRLLVAQYQAKVGMTRKIADLRARYPIQYLHLLRAGYFEPIPVAWAQQNSNPLKFSIESAAGWRGITPAWRGYEDTAEERLYWALNHREGSTGARMKPDQISAMNMARQRMAMAVAPPPIYFSNDDVCHQQHTSDGYSKQVMPAPFKAFDAPEVSTDDTMILLDVSGSMNFDPVRPIYNEFLITGYAKGTQPKNKAHMTDVSKAIIRRFTDAMANHDHNFAGYELITFASAATHIGTINHQNLDAMWSHVRLGGGTRVMTGWQKVKDLHFQKHSESATHHPVYGWQAGPQTPMLRLLLLLDGEATDMDEFELDLLGLNWVHVTIFLIGVDGCPHHHRHANELTRINDVNHHVSFVDAQGNTPERFVTHELLKRHLGQELSMNQFVELEAPPAYIV
ncbi:hypothetical protein BJ878DRAFT_40390 [Calycina marina]|uniref:VWFA domain-containing protein n=1 Tax=Calycina marina TaxID=1763456 RepID=A0A9P7Z444_9HELO|nr:hypothetical protein BJ878DRAFT_40390 [Calycina marina]